jgi:hypothetical protein
MLIVVDTARNELHFELAPPERVGEPVVIPADLDIGERGRLLSLELLPPDGPPMAIVIDDRPDPYARTARVHVTCRFTTDGAPARVTLPRRGAEYEISYPSGNECWLDAAGARHCAITRS